VTSRTPAVSVVVPVYNGERFLGDALASIRRQAVDGVEIIIVNDGSTDRTDDVARAFPHAAAYIAQENRGPSAARNRGIERSRAEIVTFLDADDIWPDGSLAGLLAVLEAKPHAGIVQGLTSDFWPPEVPGELPRLGSPGPPHLTFNVGGAAFRRSAFETAGLFNESLRYGEDLDLLFRARELGVVRVVVDQVAVLYRRRQTPPGYVAWTPTWPRLLKMSLDRRRAGGGEA
jgi:glycosyltransferase involved in cell wall biosynthesis